MLWGRAGYPGCPSVLTSGGSASGDACGLGVGAEWRAGTVPALGSWEEPWEGNLFLGTKSLLRRIRNYGACNLFLDVHI